MNVTVKVLTIAASALALGIAVSVSVPVPVPGRGEETLSCLVCHSELRLDYQAGIHTRFGVSCVDCHGGDPVAVDPSAMSPEAGFQGVPDRTQVPALCATCHADPVRMKPYGVPTDQYVQYLTSRHGQRLLAGDTRVAVCTDCHTAHRILPADEPTSTTAPENVPRTCARCHADADLMAAYGLPWDQMEKFTSSVHGLALFQEETPLAPSCATCHGSHGAVPPQVQDIAEVCGQCHIQTRRLFLESPHRAAIGTAGFSECVSCHGEHDIRPPTADLFDVACVACHSEDSEPHLEGQKLKTALIRAREALAQADQVVAEARRAGLDVEVYPSRLVEARAYLTEALAAQHTLQVEPVQDLTRKARSIAEDVRAQVHGLQASRRWRLIGLTLVWGYVLWVITLLVFHRARLRRERAVPVQPGGASESESESEGEGEGGGP